MVKDTDVYEALAAVPNVEGVFPLVALIGKSDDQDLPVLVYSRVEQAYASYLDEGPEARTVSYAITIHSYRHADLDALEDGVRKAVEGIDAPLVDFQTAGDEYDDETADKGFYARGIAVVFEA